MREEKLLTSDHSAHQWPCWDSNLGPSDSNIHELCHFGPNNSRTVTATNKLLNFLFRNYYRFTGSCGNNTEVSCAFSHPPSGYIPHNSSATPRPGNWHWYNVCISFCHFITCGDSRNHSNQPPQLFHPHKDVPCATLYCHIHIYHPQLLATTNLFAISTTATSRMLCK